MPLRTKEDRAAYARRWRVEHPEAVKAHELKKRSKPGRAAAATERMRLWRLKQLAERPEEFKEKQRLQNKAYMDANREQRRAYEKKYRADHGDKLRAYDAKYHRDARKKNPQWTRSRQLWQNYKITLEDYEALLAAQGGHCAMCPAAPDAQYHGVLHVDHDHGTGRVRGLLCHHCNTAIGLLREDANAAARMAQYLRPEGSE